MGGTLVWFRRDLRLADQPALQAALCRGGPAYPVYIFAPEEEAPWVPGAASRWWLHHSLAALQAAMRQRGMALLLQRGPSLEVLDHLVRELQVDAVFWNRLYEPAIVTRDSQIKTHLRAKGLEVRSFNAALLVEPWEVKTGSGDPYRVFSPFWKACKRVGLERRSLANSGPETWGQNDASLAGDPSGPNDPSSVTSSTPGTLPLEAFELLPKLDWADGFQAHWQPGEAGAIARAEKFLDEAVQDYAQGREIPALPGTSRLSPHLHFGEISPRQLLQALRLRNLDPEAPGVENFVRELGWREFGHHLIYHFPQTAEAPLNPRFANFPWRDDPSELRAWQRGQTGIPIVDAAMRELWQTGWMHNRARMIVGSFLTKNLRMHWLEGARWFWDTLVDADLAANTLGWQWAGGSGADAAPYFRIFNPVLQGERFDPEGDYVRSYIPELANHPRKTIHAPWTTSRPSYTHPIVDLKASRDAALAAFAQIREKKGTE